MSGRRGRKQKREEKAEKEKAQEEDVSASPAQEPTEQPQPQGTRPKTKAEIAAEKEAARNAKFDAIARGEGGGKKVKGKRTEMPVGASAPAGAPGAAPGKQQGAAGGGAWGGGFGPRPAKGETAPQQEPPSTPPAPSAASASPEPSTPSTTQHQPPPLSKPEPQPASSPAMEARVSTRKPAALIDAVTYCRKPPNPVPQGQTTVEVEANYFEVLRIPDNKFFHQHDVSITRKDNPEKDFGSDFNRKIFRHPRVQEILYRHRIAYDGRAQLFTLGKPIEPARVEIEHPEVSAIKIVFAIKPVGIPVPVSAIHSFIKAQDARSPSTEAQRALMALEIFFRATPSGNTLNSRDPFILLGRKFFDRDQEGAYLEGGIELLEGIFQTLRPGVNKLYANVDLSWNAFWMRNVNFYELACRMARDSNQRTVTMFIVNGLIGLKYYQKHQGKSLQGKIHTVHGIEAVAAKDHRFAWQHNGKEQKGSVADYVYQKYNVTLQHPEFPFMLVNTFKRTETDLKTGESSVVQHKSFVPFELAFVKEGQAPKPKKGLTARQSELMMRSLGKYKPHLRKQIIQTIVGKLNWATDDVLRGEISVSTQMTKCTGKLLAPPTIVYNGNKKVDQSKLKLGSWNAVNNQLFEPATIHNWAICNLDRAANQSAIRERLIPELRRAATSLGMPLRVQEPYFQTVNLNDNSQGMRKSLHEFYQKARSRASPDAAKGTVIIFILPKQPMDVYDILKKVCHVDLGCHCTVILGKVLHKFDNQVANNILLKINPKLGGINSRVIPTVLDQQSTMHIGIDVTHPGAHAEGMSIAAIVASTDVTCTKYVAHTALQKTKEGSYGGVTSARAEPVENMAAIMNGIFNIYQRRNQGKLPQRIIVWRDGVGESQFDEIMKKEGAAIQDACSAAAKSGPVPKLTLCIVQKRHHMRIFPVSSNSRNPQDRSGNCAPGIFIDDKIVAPNVFNFYGLSHKAFQGTVRPIHYQVLIDENNFNYIQLEQLAFNNCYNFSRATTSVSMPAACAYSHLVSKKARSYIAGTRDQPRLLALHPNIRETMWFN